MKAELLLNSGVVVISNDMYPHHLSLPRNIPLQYFHRRLPFIVCKAYGAGF